MTLPTDPKARKAIPVYSGFIKYFPRAMCAVAELSRIGNDQHNPGKPLHWDRSKSSDEMDALTRHMLDDVMGVPADTDGVLHATKLAWRAMANLEKVLERRAPAEGYQAEVDRMRAEGTYRDTVPAAQLVGFSGSYTEFVHGSGEEAWRPHDGGPMPCAPETRVEVKYRNGKGSVANPERAKQWDWGHIGDDSYDIVFWRPAK